MYRPPMARYNQAMRYYILLGAIAGLTSGLAQVLLFGGHAGDLTIPLWGARELLQGHNPYAADYSGLSPNNPEYWPLYYPLPALLVLLPLTPFPDPVAAGTFFGISVAALAYTFRDRPYLIILLLGHPFISAMLYAQWSPLMCAASVLCPALCWCKPNVGAALVAADPPKGRGSWMAIAVLGVLALLSIPLGWGQSVTAHQNFTPILAPLGITVLIMLFRWRDPNARCVLFLACVPQRWYVDAVPLGLAARTWHAALFLTLLSWCVPIMTAWRPSDLWTVLFLYLPAALLVIQGSRQAALEARR
jgi:hypothetical protein